MQMVPWESAWYQALYDPDHGFYRRQAPCGHFTTAAQGAPGTAHILAQALIELCRRHDLDTVVDLASGRGELATALTLSAPHLQIYAVDIGTRPPGIPDRITWITTPGGADLTGLPHITGALTFALEWLDVVPCPIWQLDEKGTPRTLLVSPDGRETLGPAPGEPGGPSPDDLAWCQTWWPLEDQEPGSRIEVGRPRDKAWNRLLDHVPHGLAIAVDYGHTAEARPTRGTLTGYRHGRHRPPIPDGASDVTAHVAVDSLTHDRLDDQRNSLNELGIDAGPPDPGDAAGDPTGYLTALSASSTAARLLDPYGLGNFTWVYQRT
ncbi:SAM-dependent methyltransferase [Austwickia chelonae]|uniref:SAM-dependent methyltransferase n=1 Tax=Austwickia chelonae TaxID=100225 RepID=UPI000E26DB40|nr:SAM-dependent methyltransferase [Austwickia chelonae]